MIKLLCLDIDGTLLNSQKKLPEENKEAVKYAMEKGVEIVLATGRSGQGSLKLASELEIYDTAVCLNGGLIKYRGKDIWCEYMDNQDVEKVISLAEKYRVQLFLANEAGNITAGKLTGELREKVNRGSLAGEYIFCESYGELAEAARRSRTIKLAIQNYETGKFADIRRELEEIKTVKVERSDDYFFDIIASGSGKGKGVQRLAGYLQIELRDVMCIGDNENDIDMLRAAGIGIAMENAVPEVKQAAAYITCSNDEGGVAKAIYRYI